MIREIHIRNYALIDDLSLEFEKGFSIFTGETGAGKSILVGAISLLLGERASTEAIRSGAEETEVSGVFEISRPRPRLKKLLEELAVPPQDGTLIIRRRISRGDRNRILVNQAPLPLSALKKLGDALVDLHGQHEHQSLLSEDTHEAVIDDLPGVLEVRRAYDSAWTAYSASKSESDAFEAKAQRLAERRDMLEFQFKEIESLGLKTGEEEEIEAQLGLLTHSAESSAALHEIVSLLAARPGGIEQQVSLVRKKLETLARFDPAVHPWIADIGNTLPVFTELETFAASCLEKFNTAADPARIERLNARLAKIQRLQKKHTCSYADLLARREALKRDLDSIENTAADRVELSKKLAAALAYCRKAGEQLSTERKRAAAAFDRKVTLLMEQLGFTGGRWRTEFTGLAEPAAGGLENIRFTVQTNPGEPLLPLVKSASGGEISRLMLAIKTVLSAHDQVPVLIFDEIDTGIGGMLARTVGAALAGLAKTHQVLCITHLHQIASLADRHFHVYKEASGDRTVTRVELLNEKERIDEVARMLGGDSAIAREHAKELLGKK